MEEKEEESQRVALGMEDEEVEEENLVCFFLGRRCVVGIRG